MHKHLHARSSARVERRTVRRAHGCGLTALVCGAAWHELLGACGTTSKRVLKADNSKVGEASSYQRVHEIVVDCAFADTSLSSFS